MTTKKKVERRKLSLLQLATEMNNVSKACRVMGRKKFYESVDEMQKDLDAFLKAYNNNRPHQGRGMNGRTPAKAFTDGLPKNEKKDMKKAA